MKDAPTHPLTHMEKSPEGNSRQCFK